MVVRKRPVRLCGKAFTGSATEVPTGKTVRQETFLTVWGKVYGGDAEQKISSTVDTGDASAPQMLFRLPTLSKRKRTLQIFDKLLETLRLFQRPDLHLKTGVPARIRVDGDLHVDLGDLSAEQLHAMICSTSHQKNFTRNMLTSIGKQIFPTRHRWGTFQSECFHQRNPVYRVPFVAVVPPTLERFGTCRT